MAKKNPVLSSVSYFDAMSADEILARYNYNCSIRDAINEENKILQSMHQKAKFDKKIARIEQTLAAETAKLEALRNPTPKESSTPAVTSESVAESVAL